MPKLVETLAIRSKRDLVLKAGAFYLFFVLLGVPMEYAESGEFNLWRSLDDAWVTILISTPILALQFSVVTYLDTLQRRLADLAMTDMLTGLPNRRSFVEETKRARDAQAEGTMFILDADHFKRINDTYGHAAGDACLEAIAHRLLEAKRTDDIVARLGGEEFAAYLPGATEARVRQFGESLTEAIRVALDDIDGAVTFTMSVGGAHGGPDDTLQQLMSRADVALYEAKNTGRARMVIWRSTTPEADMQKAS